MKTILCNLGYIIKKKDLTEKQLQQIYKDLNVKPFIRGRRGRFAKTFKVYFENKKKICVPKFYGIEKFGFPNLIDLNNGNNINVKFNGSMRDYQETVINKVLPLIKNQKGGTICLPPGRGKTVIACKLISLLKTKTLVIVHKTFLLNQWIKRINFFLPNAKIGKIQGPKIDIEDKDIVIGMLQSISLKDDYPEDIFDSFGFLIMDECHHISSEKFSQLFQKVNTKYMIGLSATPFRDDKLEKVINWYIGDLIYYEKPKINQEILVNIYKFEIEHENFRMIYNKFTKEAQVSTMESRLIEIKERNLFIANLVKQFRKTKERKILVLSSRLEHLDFIRNYVNEFNIGTTSKYVGGMKQKLLDEAEHADIIFSTYSMSSEALDISSLNTVILATSRRKVEQSTGRILRKQKGNYKVIPLIIDIVDKIKTFINQSYTRKAYYKKITKEENIKSFIYKNKEIKEEIKKKKVKEELFVDSDSE